MGNYGAKTVKSSKITRVAIACCKSDIHLARICVASVRFRYPKIPISLIKDSHVGEFSTTELEQCWNLDVMPTSRSVHGWGFGKLEAFFQAPGERILILDADIVVLGNIIERLEQYDEDVIVWKDTQPDPSSKEVLASYVDWNKLPSIGLNITYPGYCFNTGQMVVNTGILKREDFIDVVHWEDPPRLKYPKIFFCGEQGVLNYVLMHKAQRGELTLNPLLTFANWAGNPSVKQLILRRIMDFNSDNYPFILHWAGYKPSAVSRMIRSDILHFFEDLYYYRVAHGRIKCMWRALIRNTKAIPKGIRLRVNTCRNKIRPIVKRFFPTAFSIKARLMPRRAIS